MYYEMTIKKMKNDMYIEYNKWKILNKLYKILKMKYIRSLKNI